MKKLYYLFSKFKFLNIFIFIIFFINSNVLASDLDRFFVGLKNAQNYVIAKQYENKIWQFWITNGSSHTSNIQMQKGIVLLGNGKLNEALELFVNLSKKEPLWSEPINKIATIKFLKGDMLGSIKDIELTLALEPRHFGAISGLIQINVALKRYDNALKNLDKVVIIHPFIGIKSLRPTIVKLLKKSSVSFMPTSFFSTLSSGISLINLEGRASIQSP